MRHDDDRYSKTSFGLTDLFAVVVLIGILLAITLVSLRERDGVSTRTYCLNNIKQLALATQNYHSTRQKYPAAMGGFTGFGDHKGPERLSGFVALLPELEQQQLWETLFDPSEFNGTSFPAMPPPWDQDYPVWANEISTFRCPKAPDAASSFGQTNYAFCIGDVGRSIHNPTVIRGSFACGNSTRDADIKDGTSNTLLFAEIGTSSKRHVNSNFAVTYPNILENPSIANNLRDRTRTDEFGSGVKIHVPGRGASWAEGAAGNGLVNTILGPNSPSVAIKNQLAVDGVYSAGSFHKDGCNVAFADGSARFITDGIDVGDSSIPIPDFSNANKNMKSPYGVWGAIGTKDGSEKIDRDF